MVTTWHSRGTLDVTTKNSPVTARRQVTAQTYDNRDRTPARVSREDVPKKYNMHVWKAVREPTWLKSPSGQNVCLEPQSLAKR